MRCPNCSGLQCESTTSTPRRRDHGSGHSLRTIVPDDQLLIDDLLGIGGPAATMPAISPDERRRRLTTLFVAASLAQTEPTVYVIEDAHWIDEVSESMLAEFFAVIPQTPVVGLDHLPPRIPGRAEPGAGCPESDAASAEGHARIGVDG